MPNGIGENDTLVTFLRAQRKLGSSLTLDLAAGGFFDGELTIEDSNGNLIGADPYDAAPFVALTFAGRF